MAPGDDTHAVNSGASHPMKFDATTLHAGASTSLPSEFSAGPSKRSGMGDRRTDEAPVAARTPSDGVESTASSSPLSAPPESLATSSDSSEGLRVSIKATEPRSPKRQVVRLMRPMPLPAETSASESVPTLQRASPLPARGEDASSNVPPAAREVTADAPRYEASTPVGVTPRPPSAPVEAHTSLPSAPPVMRVLSSTPAAFRAPGSVAQSTPVVRPAAPAVSRPRSRLTFLPPTEAAPVAPPSSPEPERAVPPAALATSQVVRQVSQGLTPVLERAQQVTHEALTVERSSRPASTPAVDSGANAAVRNTFNVNVQLGTETATAGMDRRTLEDALVDILRETARRHGLEV
ncbi:hypothetical protein HUA74_17260 [Myxococcus sp. CA051A]|uniref:hypothetical protein n=1 Tax=unclassified Myxococcus TaxID=2648731 RepID=UPI00157AF878|nr:MULTISPECIES: hypothetical protein [unclassified Myxococcus]NTX54784.1 hypothetical protein [Myxococcus sp. CA039A]NTX62404.1 hypothetical protein [Myxococcus sp. CA051A]